MDTAMTAQERLQAARQAATEGRHEEALREFIWFHHHALDERASLGGVRLSYALYYWLDLGKAYPPALQALDDLRAHKAQALLRGEGDLGMFLDVCAIDRVKEDSRATYELYLALSERQPALAAQCAQLALPAIVAARDYPLADRLRGDPEMRIRTWAEELRWDIHWAKRRGYTRAPVRWSTIKRYADGVRLHLEIVAGVGHHDEARRLAALAVDLVDDPSLRAAVRAALARPSAHSPGMARLRQRQAKARRREARCQARFCTSVRMS
jgi:hypothetical protein